MPRLALAAFILLAAPSAFAQVVPSPASPAGLPQWDVVSVKKSNLSACAQSLLLPTPDGMHIECLSLQVIIKQAYGIVEDSRILGAPSWLKDTFYSIDAKVSGDDAAAFAKLSKDQRNLMLQELLADRFKLKAQRETRDFPIYALVVAKNGTKLKEWKPGESGTPMMRMKDRGEIEATGSTLDFLPVLLTRELDRPVVDKTGLTGKYDFTLQFTPAASESTDSTAPSIFTAIQEQLGLKLEPQKAPMDVLVIDHIEPPSPN